MEWDLFSFILAFTVAARLNAETSDNSIQYETGGYYEGEFKDGNFYGQHTSTYAHGHHYVRVSTRKVIVEEK